MYTWVDHTSELQLQIEAASERGVFEDAVAALRELLEEGGRASERQLGAADQAAPETRKLAVAARDRAALLAEFLSELIFAADTHQFVPLRVVELEISDRELAARIEGYRGRPRQLVKAVTYHSLALEPSRTGWSASVVLDV